MSAPSSSVIAAIQPKPVAALSEMGVEKPSAKTAVATGMAAAPSLCADRLIDALPAIVAYIDRDETCRFINAAYEAWCETSPGSVLGHSLHSAFASWHPQIAPYVAQALLGETASGEVQLTIKRAKRHAMVVCTPQADERGAILGLTMMVIDMAQPRSKSLTQSDQEFKTLVENSPDVITRIDREMRHLYANPAIEATFGLKADAYLGKTKAELGLPASMVAAWDQAAKTAFDTGAPQRFEFSLTDQAGQTRHFSVRLVPEPGPDGRIVSVLGTTHDVTERVRMASEHDALLARERHARIQAETSARARDEFLAIVSHELRAPLNGIQSWAHILENYVAETATAPLAQRALTGIKTGIAQQVRLIEDLLDVTRMVSGKLRLVKQPLAFLPVLQAAVASVRTMAAAKQVTIDCQYGITAEQISGDADRVQQIFWNLLSNAIKFTPQSGHVWLTAETSGSTICVTVKDDGIGISPEFLPHLFDRFSQQDTSSTRGHTGLGLGLFLVRHLVELHGGWVNVASEGAGLGTSFSVHLPLALSSNVLVHAMEDTDAPGLPLPSLEGMRILLIDDEQEARDALTMVLTSAGASVFATATSRDAIDWLHTLAEEELPDMLVSDIAMPEEDGYTVLRKIRAWQPKQEGTPLQRMPALALTAFSQREDRIRALTAGFQMHMSKPVVPEELIVVIANLVRHS